jgi:hypothetical protein
MVRRCRFIVEMGADAVICCHTHCPLPWEIHAGRPIIYGLGNLIFETRPKMPDSWYEGYLARLILEDGHIRFEPIPYVQSREQAGVYKMNDLTRDRFLREMELKNAQIKDDTFIDSQWKSSCAQQKVNYLTGLFAYNRIMRKIRKLLLRTIHPKRDVLRALHLVQCETHQEVLSTLFRLERQSK